MATYANLYVDQGADFETNFFVEDSQLDPIDLSNTTIEGQIRRTYTSETAYDFSIDVIDVNKGQFSATLSAEVTAAMRPGRYLYDIYAVYDNGSIDGSIYKLVEGEVEVIPQITRVSTNV